jgi:hypothetical protein
VTEVLRNREHFETVAPRIRRVEAADTRERVVPLDGLVCGLETLGELVQLRGCQAEGRVRLPRRRERILDADVELASATEREPDASSRSQRFRLLDLVQPEQAAEEAARLVLAAGRRCELDVI